MKTWKLFTLIDGQWVAKEETFNADCRKSAVDLVCSGYLSRFGDRVPKNGCWKVRLDG